ncbi:PREDICTED: protein ENHANCED DISEASE RESISTANCE 2-like isoform X1 [Nelumbo nucifera]|uniref:Protein ENHANCED DISEASE RESISTANCE 2-like isoform X1 n=1 Tax=Nelumbo nucifera TaxID=4432 RepID=A0A1U7YY62_NELNU|nr:PREDICTED: protein ENHANCED DISEASE RESISTANCE 2-like isoform X1 [Nelumbo nucifera]
MKSWDAGVSNRATPALPWKAIHNILPHFLCFFRLNLEGHRPWMRRYAHSLKKLIRIGKGPEMLLRQSSRLGNFLSDGFFEGNVGDAIEAHEWKCVRTVNGIRIFEDVDSFKSEKGVLLKSVGVVDANLDTVFDVVLSLDRHKRYEWDMLTGDLELVDSVNGHYDVVYATYDPKHLTRWQSKRDFVFSRQWFRGQDGSYTILQSPAIHNKRPPRPGYRRVRINPSTWEIRGLNEPLDSNAARCLVTLILEIDPHGWGKWKKNDHSKFEYTIPNALLCQVAALKEYFGANPALTCDFSTNILHSKSSNSSGINNEFEDGKVNEEFYDATAADSLCKDEDSDDGLELTKMDGKVNLKNVSWAVEDLALKHNSVSVESNELDDKFSPISIDASQFHGSMCQGKDETDVNCWASPGGQGFMIRGKTYLHDNSKVMGGDPLLKLLAVDWFKSDHNMDKVALSSKCLVQSEAGKKLPFILVINLQVPAKPNYSMVLYYGANRPIKKQSLLDRFIDGSDMFRNARFKLIPSIIEGYWMVKRAVGTKACLLGKAVTCRYLRKDNFLEIDVDIGSSSVARSVIGLVLGYVTSIVVDLAILVEAKEEPELPEYILGTVRLNRVRPDSAVPFEV